MNKTAGKSQRLFLASTIQTSWGVAVLVTRAGRIAGFAFPRKKLTTARLKSLENQYRPLQWVKNPPGSVKKRIQGYFEGATTSFRDCKLDYYGVTPYHNMIYEALRNIPFGRVISYGHLAQRAAKPGARACGGAMAANPIPLIVGCHRVVRADGACGGFSAGESLKQKLLRHEGIRLIQGKIDPIFFIDRQ